MGQLAQSEHSRVGTHLCYNYGALQRPGGPNTRPMPAILAPGSYLRWLSLEPDPHDLLITYPSEPMTMRPISTRVNKPENDDPSLLDRIGDPFDVWAPLTSVMRA